jgi:hypothetical protein
MVTGSPWRVAKAACEQVAERERERETKRERAEPERVRVGGAAQRVEEGRESSTAWA